MKEYEIILEEAKETHFEGINLYKQIMKIEKNIPIPKKYCLTKYPFQEMEIGDSFFVECDTKEGRKTMCTINSSKTNYIKRFDPEKMFLMRLVEGGIRVWRTK